MFIILPFPLLLKRESAFGYSDFLSSKAQRRATIKPWLSCVAERDEDIYRRCAGDERREGAKLQACGRLRKVLRKR